MGPIRLKAGIRLAIWLGANREHALNQTIINTNSLDVNSSHNVEQENKSRIWGSKKPHSDICPKGKTYKFAYL